ncbi:hypothetical protein LINGRAHAP2_LOCUS21301 [Linum grandiflorum]
MFIRKIDLIPFSVVSRRRSAVMTCLNRCGADPSFYRSLSSLPSHRSPSPLARNPSLDFSRVKAFRNIVTNNVKAKETPFRNGFMLTCCLDSQHKTVNDQRAHAIPSHSQLVRDLECRTEENHGDAGLVSVHTARHGGKPFGFGKKSAADKVVVAVDVDEVLGNFVSVLNKFIADRYSMNHSVSEYHVYEFFKIWNCSRDEADTRVHEFFKTAYFKNGIDPLPGARQVLHKLSSHCKLSVVTYVF